MSISYYSPFYSNNNTFIDANREVFNVITETETFSIVFYENSSENNRVNKTPFLNNSYTVNGILRESSSLLTPIITVEFTSVPTFNYCFIEIWNRYYFITEIVAVNDKLYTLTLKVDVLMTFKDSIKNISANIERQEFRYNSNMNDSLLPASNDKNITIIESNIDADDLGFGEYVLTLLSKSEVIT